MWRHVARPRSALGRMLRLASETSLPQRSNTYINLGKFETMGSDVGRAATGLAYLQETLQMQSAEYQAEEKAHVRRQESPIRKSAAGLGLAKTLHEVGRQHHHLGDAEEAIQHYLKAQELLQEAITLREQDGKTSKALTLARFIKSEVCSSLGVAYNDSSRPKEAEMQHQEALQLRKELVGKDHPSMAECLNNLGGLYFARGAYQKAAEHYEQALELLPPNTPFMALTLYNLGLCRASLGQFPAAETCLQFLEL
eukprot:g864.t1